MPKILTVRANDYRDSIQLMRISATLRNIEGVRQAMVSMATDANKMILDDLGLINDEGARATVNDLVVAIEADSDAVIAAAITEMETLFTQRESSRPGVPINYDFTDALKAMPHANLAVISVPGEYTAAEAQKALAAGLHVFIYSDNVPVHQERALKEYAQSRGLLCMGPDCGVANLNGIALGTASKARKGAIGIVGASGSGTQQIAVLADKEGVGISQALGVGGKDLKDEVGGLAMLMGIDALDEDPETKVIVLVSRTPGAGTLPKILSRIRKCKKPVVVYFIGGDPSVIVQAGAVAAIDSEDAARKAVDFVLGRPLQQQKFTLPDQAIAAIVAKETAQMSPAQRYLRGLFIGGTFAEEAMSLMRETIGDVYSNAPLVSEKKLWNSRVSLEHSIIDLGDEEFTKGRAHPGIDPEPIRQAILREGTDPQMAVLLMDFILGPALNPDPAGSVISEIKQIKADCAARGGYLSVIAAVCGTEDDPQNLALQEQVLHDAGVVLMPSNGQAARLAGLIAQYACNR
jgi:FdrA protein